MGVWEREFAEAVHGRRVGGCSGVSEVHVARRVVGNREGGNGYLGGRGGVLGGGWRGGAWVWLLERLGE